MLPKVTVLMPVYNGVKYLAESIESILNQTFTDFEFIIIDDCSTDDSYKIIESYKDKRIRLFRNETNSRVAETLNKGMKLAQGEYIARMDADDVSLPERLAKQVGFLDKNKDIDIVGSWVKVIGDDHEYVWKYESDPEKLRTKIFFNCSMAHPTVMMRRKAMMDNGFMYNNMGVEDFDLWARACEKVKMSNINEVLLNYRINASQSSGTLSGFHADGLNKVLARQIRKLGIEPTAEETEIHRMASNYQPKNTIEFINQASDWFIKISEANEYSLCYDRGIFSECIGDLWYALLIRNLDQRSSLFKVFINSEVSKNLSFRQKIKFIIKYFVSLLNMKNKKSVVILSLLAIVIVLLGLNYMVNRGKAARTSQTTAINQQQGAAVSSQGKTAVFYAGDKKYDVEIKDNESVYDLMNSLKEKGRLSFSGKDYKGAGFFVEEINGIKNSTKDNKYWIYYINGKSANIGISQYIIKPGDNISWKYETPKF